NAWASLAKDSKADLTLTFVQPVVPTKINIYVTFNPGSITSVVLIPAVSGDPITLPNSADLTVNCPGAFILRTPKITTPINKIVIHLDQSKIQNWEEIDAVQLIGQPAAANK